MLPFSSKSFGRETIAKAVEYSIFTVAIGLTVWAVLNHL
jgi:hypothetical protein